MKIFVADYAPISNTQVTSTAYYSVGFCFWRLGGEETDGLLR
jgi:hypothetical protein